MDYEVAKEGRKLISYPEQDFTIRYVSMLHHNVEVYNVARSERSWKANFRCTSDQHPVLHIKIYATKADIHQKEIKAMREEITRLDYELKIAKRDLLMQTEQTERIRQEIGKDILENHAKGLRILEFVANEVHCSDVFNELVDNKAYIGDAAVCARKVQGVYMKLGRT